MSTDDLGDLSWLDDNEQELDPRTPIEQLEELARNANSEAVRVQALRALLDRGIAEPATKEAMTLAREVTRMDDDQLERELIGVTVEVTRTDQDLEREVERRVSQRVAERLRELREGGQLHPAVPANRASDELPANDQQAGPEEPDATPERPPNPTAPPGLSADDVAATWNERHGSAPEPVRVLRRGAG